ncbi:hypothetical protein ACN47E_004550 [Coniothyrium glycines]
MAATRSSTGSSKPRIIQQIQNTVAPKKRSTTTAANTSKPRSTTTTGRVTKRTNVKNVKKPRTKTEKLTDKITGNAKRVSGDVQGKPGKKAAGTRKARGTDSMVKRRV